MFLLLIFLLSISASKSDRGNVQTKYVCPEDFQLVGRKCYHFSKNNVTWQDSHYYCLTLNSTLATVNNYREQNVLSYFMNNTVGTNEYWIDGIFDWKQMKWKWGTSGQIISFNVFSRKKRSDKFKWNCIVLDYRKNYKWSARKCTESRNYVCETETNIYVQFKLFKRNKNFNIAKCSRPEALNRYEKRKCYKLLGTVENNEPGYIVKRPRPTKSTENIDGYICPPHMVNLGNKCYYFSKNEATWWNSYYNCKKNKSKLAIVKSRSQDYNLRIFLNNFIEKHPRWIGGIYDWKSSQWKWAMTGQPLTYKGFAHDAVKNRTNETLAWNTIFMDPALENRWNSDKETTKKYYICQVKAKAVKRFNTTKLKPPQATIAILTE